MSGLGNINDFIEENNHGGLIEENADFYNTVEMPFQENKTVQKSEKKVTWNWKKDIGRALMSGYHTNYILDRYGLLINHSPYKDKILKYLRANDGLLGYIFVDTSLFDEKFDYSDIPSGMKKYNLYAIHSKNVEQSKKQKTLKNTDGTMDGFLSDIGNDIVVEQVSYNDRYTNLPAISSAEQINDDDVRRIGKKLLDDGKIGVRDYELFKNTNKILFLKKMFRAVTPYIKTNKKVEDVVSNFGLQNPQLYEEKVDMIKGIKVNNAKELKIDDIGDTSVKEKVQVNNSKSPILDDVGDISVKKVVVEDERVPSNEQDIVIIETENPQVEDLRQTDYDDFDIKENNELVVDDDYAVQQDGLNDSFDEVILLHENKQDIDDEQFFAPEDDGELDVDEKPTQFKISRKCSFDF